MKKITSCIIALACISSANRVQSQSLITPLEVGDQVPELVIHNILNDNKTSVTLSALKGKVIILDFFATWCSSCIEALPHLDSLQKTFGNKIQALVVDYEKPDKISTFLKKNPTGKSISLPIIASDTILKKMFPHQGIPHEVIIDQAGTVAAITYAHYLTKANIQKLLDGKSLHLPVKMEQMDYSDEKPLFYKGNGGDIDQIYIRSTFSHYIDGLAPYCRVKTDSIHKRFYCNNYPITTLYWFATNKPVLENRIILEVNDSTRYFKYGNLPRDQWIRKNTYCYEIMAPLSTPVKLLHHYMFQDLNRYLNISGRFEKRMVSCWVLVRTGNDTSLFATKGGAPIIRSNNESGWFIRNKPLSQLIQYMNNQSVGYPPIPIVLDETNYHGNVDLTLKLPDVRNLNKMQKALKPYGLQLKPARRLINMLVLTENDFGQQ